MIDIKQNNKGFSLLELLITIAISAFVILSALTFLNVGTRNYQNNSNVTTLQQEVSYANNLLGTAIREANSSNTKIYYTNNGNNIELHTGKKVFYYNDDTKSLYVYEEVPGGTYTNDYQDNFITKYIEDFNIKFIADSDNAEAQQAEIDNTNIDADGNGYVTAYTSLVEVDVTYAYKGKKEVSKVTYQIRN